MSIRKILVPLVARYDAEALKQVSEASLRAGLQLGQAFGAHVAVCCFAAAWHDPKDNLVFGIPGAAIEQLLKEIDKRNEQCFWYARSLFDKLAEEFEPHRSEDPDPSAGFRLVFKRSRRRSPRRLPKRPALQTSPFSRLCQMRITSCTGGFWKRW